MKRYRVPPGIAKVAIGDQLLKLVGEDSEEK